MHLVRKRTAELQTYKGRYFNILGHFLSIYCVYKILMTTVNIILQRVGQTDPVTRAFEIAVTWLGFDMDVRFWSQHISFLLVGVLIIASVRSLLIQLTKVLVCTRVQKIQSANRSWWLPPSTSHHHHFCCASFL